MTLLQQLKDEIAAKGVIRNKALIDAIVAALEEKQAEKVNDPPAPETRDDFKDAFIAWCKKGEYEQ